MISGKNLRLSWEPHTNLIGTYWMHIRPGNISSGWQLFSPPISPGQRRWPGDVGGENKWQVIYFLIHQLLVKWLVNDPWFIGTVGGGLIKVNLPRLVRVQCEIPSKVKKNHTKWSTALSATQWGCTTSTSIGSQDLRSYTNRSVRCVGTYNRSHYKLPLCTRSVHSPTTILVVSVLTT